MIRCREALEHGTPLRALGLGRRRTEAAARLPAPLGQAAARRHQPGRGRCDLGGRRSSRPPSPDGPDDVSVARGDAARSPLCAKIELEIAELEPADAAAFLADLGLTESGLARVIRASYDLLGYMSFFTVGEDECRAWSIPRGTIRAGLAAGEIHSDIARGFIRAEVVAYDALIARGSLAVCRDHGEVRLEGKEYVVAGRRHHQLQVCDVSQVGRVEPVRRVARDRPDHPGRA